MDMKIFSVTFITIFLAELADKTQLVNFNMSAKSGRPFQVLIASVSAYIVVAAITVLVGSALAGYIKPALIRYFGASLFMLLGILMFAGKF